MALTRETPILMAMNVVQEAAGPSATSGIQRFDPRPIEVKFDGRAFCYVAEIGSLPLKVRGKSLFRKRPLAL
jgi:hypothetical protein